MRLARTSDLWFKNAIVYCLDADTFADGLQATVDRLDHVADLGATCVWLMPLYPTPDRDDGYDIADYLAVDPRLGDLGDFAELVRHAHDRGLRVLVDLVANHSSDEHPWFKAACEDRGSPYRDYYVWTDDPESVEGTTPEKWTFHERAGQYYMHSFQPFQPDLNIANPLVRREIAKIAGFWLTLGVDGFRMDAVPFLTEEIGEGGVDTSDGRHWLHELREYCARRRGDLLLMGEANVDADDVEGYFDTGGAALHLQLAFLINQRLWLSLAREQAAPLEDLIRKLPVPPRDGGWGTFLRNHDELTLDKLPASERGEVLAAFAPDEDMRIYGHGIRRRAAPMLGGDSPRLRMTWSLTLSLPGTPVMLYGDEIGIGDDLAREGRMAVRVPMDWDEVARQRRDRDSLLAFVTRLLHARRRAPELGWGTSTLLENDPPELFAHRSDWEGSTVVVAHNLSGRDVTAQLEIESDAVEDLLEPREHTVSGGRLQVELGPYGYIWLRLR